MKFAIDIDIWTSAIISLQKNYKLLAQLPMFSLINLYYKTIPLSYKIYS